MDKPTLYIFAGYPKTGLSAGGVRLFTQLENIGLLEEDPAIEYRKEGVFVGDEWSHGFDYHFSHSCTASGIGWKWFEENWSCGNSVTVHKTIAKYPEVAAHRAKEKLFTEFAERMGIEVITDDKVELKDRPDYEVRWAEGFMPQESHVVQLTWLIFKHSLPQHAYETLMASIEDPTYRLEQTDAYDDSARYRSEIRELVGV